MPDWLENTTDFLSDSTEPLILLARLLLALVLGLLVAGVYRRTTGGESLPSFVATLVLLTILIAAVTQVIGDNVARAFSLVGALAIVRFRTVVRDTRDTAFVIFAVTVGMAVGAGDLWVAGGTLAVTSLACTLLSARKPRDGSSTPFQLLVVVGLGQDAEALLAPVLQRRVARQRLLGTATANRGASVETRYEIGLQPGVSPAVLVQELNDLEGVQSVQLRIQDGSVD